MRTLKVPTNKGSVVVVDGYTVILSAAGVDEMVPSQGGDQGALKTMIKTVVDTYPCAIKTVNGEMEVYDLSTVITTADYIEVSHPEG